jgi:hypothetical protein
MATSFWTKYNPNISVEHTTKKFYGRYLYRAVVYAPAGRVIDDKKSIQSCIDYRRMLATSMSGWYQTRLNKDLDKVDISFLEKLRELRHNKLPGIKLRVEEPYIQIYADSLTNLENLVIDYFQHFPHSYVTSISTPADAKAEAILNSGAIIRKTDSGFKYKVLIRDGKYPPEIKHSILQYLYSLGTDQVTIPPGGIEMLTKTSSYIWNLYFYVNDPALVTFLNLISPGMVSNIHELVVL